MTYEQSTGITLALLVAVLGVGAYLGITAPNQPPLYPFSSWSLYHVVPGDMSEYVLLVHEAGEKRFEKPITLHSAYKQGLLKEYVSPTAYWKGVQRLGSGLETGDAAVVLAERQRIENNFSARPVRYEVTRVTYDVLEYWRSGAFRAFQNVGELHVE